MASPITRYAQNVATEQIPFANYPGGGPLSPLTYLGAPIQYNDPGVEIGQVRLVTAIYQMYGNEASSDIVNLYLAQPGTMVKPTGSISGSAGTSASLSGVATTCTVDIGDDDGTGQGLVSQRVLGASPTRYASNVNIATGQTNPIAFAGGDSLVDPYQIGTLAIEPQGSSPGAGIAGSWIQMRFRNLATPVTAACIIVRLEVIKPGP